MDLLLRVLKAVSDLSRLRMLNLIVTADEICVCDLERTLGFSQTKVSRHLTILKAAGLVRDRRQGLWTLYTYTGNQSKEIRQIMKGVLENLNIQPVLLADVATLRSAVKNGKCTTFNVINPGQAPKSIRPISGG